MNIWLFPIRQYILFCVIFLNAVIIDARNKYESTLFVDTTSALTISEIVKEENFQMMKTQRISKGFTSQHFWIKITPITKFSKDERIGFSNAYNHYETIYYVYAKDSIVHFNFGINQGFQSATFLPSFALDPDIKEIYVSIKSDSFLYDEFEILQANYVIKKSSLYLILQVSFIGLALLILLYISYLYYKSKQSILKFYAYYVFSNLLMFLFISNFGRYLIWDNLPFSNSYSEGIFSLLLVVSYTVLTMKITNIKTFNHTIHTASVYFLIAYVGTMITLFVFQNQLIISKVSNMLPGIALLFIVVFAVIGKINQNHNGGLYLVGIFTFIASSFLRISINWGLIEYSIFIEVLVYAGIILELTIFTYVVIKNVEHELQIAALQKDQLIAYANQIEKLQSQIEKFNTHSEGNNTFHQMEISPEINQLLQTPLTKRELEVLIELSNGGKYDEVSDRLFISKSTLKTHISKIYVKLDSKNRIDAINVARELSRKVV